jgi:hypothetical protein
LSTLLDRGKRALCLACWFVLALFVVSLSACGGDADTSPVGKKGGEGEDGGSPARTLPGRAAAAPVLANKKKEIAPISADEYAQRKAAWDAFQRKQDGLPEAATHQGDSIGAANAVENLPPDVKRWFTDYSAVATSVKLALPRYRHAVQGNDQPALTAACTELGSSTGRLLGDPAALAAPVPGVKDALMTAYRNYQAAADACAAGKTQERDARMTAAQQAMQTATTLLHVYQIQP